MLEVDCAGYADSLKSNLEALQKPMTGALRRLTDLAYLMVARDSKTRKSCVEKTAGGAAKIKVKIPKPVSFGFSWPH